MRGEGRLRMFTRLPRTAMIGSHVYNSQWKCVTDGEASWFEHRHCDNPDSYAPRPETSNAE